MHLSSIIQELRQLNKINSERVITAKELSQILTLFMHYILSGEEIAKAIEELDGN